MFTGTFAAMCSMSTKAMYIIKKDKGNPTISPIEAILRKFGLRLVDHDGHNDSHGLAWTVQPRI